MKKSSTITEVLDSEYREYGMYTIEHRAIPSAVDGFKPTQRKAAHTASGIWRTGSEKPLKVFQLTGKMAAECAYHHGDASGSSTIIGMAQTFKNSLPVFEGIGQFGSLRCPEAGAPRYVSVRLSESFRDLYMDEDLLERRVDDGVPIEPKFFLPIVPTVLLNGTSGIAVGFATNILNRSPQDLVRCCLEVLRGKKPRDPLPWWRDFSGSVKRGEGQQWIMSGTHQVKDTTTVIVTELPPSMTFAKYEAHLDSLVEKGRIASYEDKSSATPHYVVKFTRAALRQEIADGGLPKLLKLVATETENITCLDETGRLREFSSAIELVEWFVSFRTGFYSKRKDLLLKKADDRILTLSNKARFIRAILEKELVIERRKRQQVEADLASMGFSKRDGGYTYLLSMPMHSLTKETYDQLLSELEEEQRGRASTAATPPREMYEADLAKLQKKIK